MDPTGTLPLKTAIVPLLGVILAEMAAAPLLPAAPVGRLAAVGGLRAVEAALLLAWIGRRRDGRRAIGLQREFLGPGLKAGGVGALALGLTALCGGWIAHAVLGIDAIALIRAPVPGAPAAAVTFLLVAGIVSPLAEEIFFRGLVYGLMRRWGAAAAVLATTALFAAAHPGPGFPAFQAIGGLVFALAREMSGSLAAPVTIHVLGNLSIFALSMLHPAAL